MEETRKVFDTDKRIRLGIWGLGRGQAFLNSCKFLNIDVVAGCDYNESMRKNFLEHCPDAFATGDEDEFLAQDFDAVLIATFFPNHTRDSLKALKAGKHVMCEVTSFFTPAEGVELVEAVEKSGKVYNLLENYPFQKNCMYIKKLWDEGVFGELMYAEFDYVHEYRALSFLRGDLEGFHAHNWRSWLNYHYYCTHSLGPVMRITGTRPVEITALPTTLFLNGFLGKENLGGFAPSLIRMDNGGLVRNLMASSTGDSHMKRLWGRFASVDLTDDIKVRVGAAGLGHQYQLNAKWDSLGEMAEKAGHGGGDFWELYYFARQIFTGEKAPWDIYAACDVTLAGIMAMKSCQSGRAEKIPDFRDKAVREQFRNDHFVQKHFDPDHLFPENQDKNLTGKFSPVMYDCYGEIILVRNVFDGMKIRRDFAGDSDRLGLIEDVRALLTKLPEIADHFKTLRKIMETYPDTLPAQAIKETLELGYEGKVLAVEQTSAELRAWLEAKE